MVALAALLQGVEVPPGCHRRQEGADSRAKLPAERPLADAAESGERPQPETLQARDDRGRDQPLGTQLHEQSNRNGPQVARQLRRRDAHQRGLRRRGVGGELGHRQTRADPRARDRPELVELGQGVTDQRRRLALGAGMQVQQGRRGREWFHTGGEPIADRRPGLWDGRTREQTDVRQMERRRARPTCRAEDVFGH